MPPPSPGGAAGSDDVVLPTAKDDVLAVRLGDCPPLDRAEVAAAEAAMRRLVRNELPDRGLDFDAFKHSFAELYGIVLGMFFALGIATRAPQLEVLLAFLRDVALDYRPNPYHSWYHAVDVTYMVFHSLTEFGVGVYLSRAEMCALLLSAVAHDVLHPGKNNLFQINAGAEVAKRYNGISVLENQSIDHSFALMRKHDLLAVLTLDEVPELDGTLMGVSPNMDGDRHSEASDGESDSGLWMGSHPAPTRPGAQGTTGGSGQPASGAVVAPLYMGGLGNPPDRIKRVASDSPKPPGAAESPRPTSRRASLASVGSSRGGSFRRPRTPRDRQMELGQLVEELFVSAILYTDMKSHFQLQDKLEKIIEQADADEDAPDDDAANEEISPFVAAAIRRRISVSAATSQNSSSVDVVHDASSAPAEDDASVHSNGSVPRSEPSRTSSRASSTSVPQASIRRKSVLVAHADDDNPSLDDVAEKAAVDRVPTPLQGSGYTMRRRSILVQHADDNDPHGDDDDGPGDHSSSGRGGGSEAGSRSETGSRAESGIRFGTHHTLEDERERGRTHTADEGDDAPEPHGFMGVPPMHGGPRRPSVQFSDIDEIVRVNSDAPVEVISVQARTAEIKFLQSRRRKSMEFEQRKLLTNAILHAADISNAARPWTLCKKWSDFVVQEFFQQGDAERELGLTISPNMDRYTADQYSISIGFIDFLCKPFYEVLADLLPGMAPLVENLHANRNRWAELQAKEKEEKERLEKENADRESITSPSSALSVPMLSRTTTSGGEEVLLSPGVSEQVPNVLKDAAPLKVAIPVPPPARKPEAVMSPGASNRSSLDSTVSEPIKQSSGEDDRGHNRRFSAAAGTIELPDQAWFASHQHRPHTHGRGLSALHSFSQFLTWKRLHSGASTPNLVGLVTPAIEGSLDGSRRKLATVAPLASAAADEDVLQALGWDDFQAGEEAREIVQATSPPLSPRRRSGPNLAGLAMTIRNPKTGAPEDRIHGVAINRRLSGAPPRSVSVDVYRSSAKAEEDKKAKQPPEGRVEGPAGN